MNTLICRPLALPSAAVTDDSEVLATAVPSQADVDGVAIPQPHGRGSAEGDAWLAAWAKSGRDPQNYQSFTHWLPLHEHLADTAAVAELLVDRWVAPLVITRIADAIGGQADDVRRLVKWLAAVHDVGKVSPAFAVQVPVLADAMRPRGLVARAQLAHDPERSMARHEYVGQLATRDWLINGLGIDGGVAKQLSSVVGAHHGLPPSISQLAAIKQRSDLSGDVTWIHSREQVLSWATDLIGGPDVLRKCASKPLDRPTQALLSAIVILADWIASNAEYFPLEPIHSAKDSPRHPDPRRTAGRAATGWAQLDLPERWQPELIADAATAFATRFERPAAAIRPVQRAAVEAARAAQHPGLLVIEAPMGEGKTEAALLAAEVMAERSGANGVFVALPTRATSDAMFARVLDWMERLPGLPAVVSSTLAHGTAALNDDYRDLLRNETLRGIGDEAAAADSADEAIIAHRWLRGRKKGPLAQFVIGTVDQVLFAALRSRHLMLRHLALAGKVVIIDEVHAYDVYMSRYLDRALEWLGSYGTPVVLLSATLPAVRRGELVVAYEHGRASGALTLPDTGAGPAAQAPASAADAPPTDPFAYPVIIAPGAKSRPVATSRDPQRVELQLLDDNHDALVALLRERLADGGCAVVIRNTVRRVLKTADDLANEFGEHRVTVNHSRFLACDRARIDRELLRRFGPPGEGTDRPEPPEWHIVVASQVVEQSLDVDFDLMITDLAPVDLVLQRIGRLHRHRRKRPTPVARPRCVLVGVEDWKAAPVRAVRGSRIVYGEHQLLRAAALLGERDSITVPADIATLVQMAYGDGEIGRASWRSAMREARDKDLRDAERRRDRAGTFLLSRPGAPTAVLDGWVHAGVGEADGSPQGAAQVRDGAETIEALVVQRDRDGGLLTPKWIGRGGGIQIPTDLAVPHWLARVIAACALRLPLELSFGRVGDDLIAALERNRYDGFQQSSLLSGQLVLVLDDDRRAEIRQGAAQFDLVYDPKRGLRHEAV